MNTRLPSSAWRQRSIQQALVTLLLFVAPASALAMTRFDRTADLVYQSADRLGIGVNLSMQKSASERYYFAPSTRLGIAMGGASLAAGCSLVATEIPGALFEIDLRIAATQTFGVSDWRSGSWVGPELSVTFFYVKIDVGRFQCLGHDDPARTQFGGGIVVPF